MGEVSVSNKTLSCVQLRHQKRHLPNSLSAPLSRSFECPESTTYAFAASSDAAGFKVSFGV